MGTQWHDPALCDIIKLFEDCESSPLGIHQLLRIAAKRHFNRQYSELVNDAIKSDHYLEVSAFEIIGKWFSPSEAVSLLR